MISLETAFSDSRRFSRLAPPAKDDNQARRSNLTLFPSLQESEISMGRMRFLAPRRERIPAEALERAYVAGLDGIPTPCRKTWDQNGILAVGRDLDESSRFYVPWSISGEQTLASTTSLMEREEPYLLEVELARGAVYRLREQADSWLTAGLQIPAELTEQIRLATGGFIEAATSQQTPETAADTAQEVLEDCRQAVESLTAEYIRQVLEIRRAQTPQLPVRLGGGMGSEPMPENLQPMFSAAFHAALTPFSWRSVQPAPDRWDWSLADQQIAYCRQHQLKIFGGPLLCLEPEFFPQWVLDSSPDYDTLMQLLQAYWGNTAQRYRNDAHLWIVASGLNVPGCLPLNDEQRLRLTVAALEKVHRTDSRTPLMVGVSQPWGEYMAHQNTDLPPLHYAETLARADLGLCGLGLEFPWGYWPGALPRDLLEVSHLLDVWSLLGLPLVLQVAGPADDGDAQKEWLEKTVPLFLAKQAVQSVLWSQPFDAQPQAFPAGGLFDSQNKPKPALSTLLAIRREHLA